MQPPTHGQWWSKTETHTLHTSQWKTRGVLIIIHVEHFLHNISSLFFALLLSLFFYLFELEAFEFKLLVLIVSMAGATLYPSTRFSIRTLKFSIVFSSLLPPSTYVLCNSSEFYKLFIKSLLFKRYLCLLSLFIIIYL